MAAMRIAESVQFDPLRVFLSVLLATVFSLLHCGWRFIFTMSGPGWSGKSWAVL
jgi:NO-binding membrane sensor protein with MHYT domain